MGVTHLQNIVEQAINFYGEKNIIGVQFPAGNENDQYSFLRFFVAQTSDFMIKVEVIQNMKMMDEVELVDGIRLVSLKDIGLFKLISGSSRAAKKDIYDLDFITEHIPLTALMEMLQLKQEKYKQEEDHNIFDLDEDPSPIENPALLLKFDGKVARIRSSQFILMIISRSSKEVNLG